MSKLYEYIKERNSMIGCNIINDKWNCKDYMDCDICLKDKILEHDKQVKDKTIDDFMNMALEIIKSEQDTRYGYLDGADIREIARELKGGD